MRFSNFFSNGKVMGLSPRDINEMTIWEFFACLDGWQAANGAPEKAPAMSDEALSELNIEGF